MQVCFKVFRGDRFESRLHLYGKVAEFASRVGPAKLINIGHSDLSTGRIVVVWYWYDPAAQENEPGVVNFDLEPQEEVVDLESPVTAPQTHRLPGN